MRFHRIEGSRAEIGGDADGVDRMAKRLVQRQPIAVIVTADRPHHMALLAQMMHQGAADEAGRAQDGEISGVHCDTSPPFSAMPSTSRLKRRRITLRNL